MKQKILAATLSVLVNAAFIGAVAHSMDWRVAQPSHVACK